MSRFAKYKYIYIELLPIFGTPTLIMGFISNLYTQDHTQYNTPIDSFLKTIGYTSIVLATAVSYPISYPLLGLYYLYNKHNNK